MVPSKVTLIRYDCVAYSAPDVYGAKALLDALKYQTTGRRDGLMLYYFGAIRDDNPDDLKEMYIKQKLVENPSQASTRIIVEQSTVPIDAPSISIVERP